MTHARCVIQIVAPRRYAQDDNPFFRVFRDTFPTDFAHRLTRRHDGIGPRQVGQVHHLVLVLLVPAALLLVLDRGGGARSLDDLRSEVDQDAFSVLKL